MFTLKLLQAINDWQNEGIGINKSIIAERIKANAENLHKKFSTLNAKCYRRVDLVGKYTLEIGLNMKLPETTSSWTFQKSVAQNFMGGVPQVGYQGVIFELNPSDDNFEVIINLDELYNDPEFVNACEENKDKITNYNEGIGRYGNCENEIILEVKQLHLNQLWAYGGFSAPRAVLARMYFGHDANPSELAMFDALVKQANITIGGNWVTGTEKDRLVQFHIDKAKELTSKK